MARCLQLLSLGHAANSENPSTIIDKNSMKYESQGVTSSTVITKDISPSLTREKSRPLSLSCLALRTPLQLKGQDLLCLPFQTPPNTYLYLKIILDRSKTIREVLRLNEMRKMAMSGQFHKLPELKTSQCFLQKLVSLLLTSLFHSLDT